MPQMHTALDCFNCVLNLHLKGFVYKLRGMSEDIKI